MGARLSGRVEEHRPRAHDPITDRIFRREEKALQVESSIPDGDDTGGIGDIMWMKGRMVRVMRFQS